MVKTKFLEYKVKRGNIDKLKNRMDIIPVSIALAQAAKESGWGTSRFALEGNAIFGQWTWDGQGIAPLYRDKKRTIKFKISNIKSFSKSLQKKSKHS